MSYEVSEPILNSPFGKPGRYWYIQEGEQPVLRLAGNRTVTLKNIRPPAKTLSLSAEALVGGNGVVAQGSPSSPAAVEGMGKPQGQQADPALQKPVALVFGPENGAISERLVQEAAKEASLKNYTLVLNFAS